MKRVADTAEAIVPIPPVVVAVDVHLALVVPVVERGELCPTPSLPPPLEYSRSCILFAIIIAWGRTPSSFIFEVSAQTTLPQTEVRDILGLRILISAVSNRGHSSIRLVSRVSISEKENGVCAFAHTPSWLSKDKGSKVNVTKEPKSKELLADTAEAIVPTPPVAAAVDAHPALVVPVVERGERRNAVLVEPPLATVGPLVGE